MIVAFSFVLSVASAGGTSQEMLRYCVRGIRPVVKEQQIPGGGFYMQTGVANQFLPNTGFLTIALADVTYTLVRWPVANIPAAVRTLFNKINDSTFDTGPGGYNFPAGTLIYSGFDDNNKYYDADEVWVVDLVIQCRFRSVGWNNYITATRGFVAVSTDNTGMGGGTAPYATDDLTKLFQV